MGKVKRGKKTGIYVQGWDLSLNHGAMVELFNGELGQIAYVTDLVGSHKRAPGIASLLPARGGNEEKDVYEVRRLEWWSVHLYAYPEYRSADYIGIEGYAMGKAQGAHQMGELGGLARLACWGHRIKLRIHDPSSVKMFAAHNGGAKKPEMERAVRDRWGVDFSEYNPPQNKPTKKHPEGFQNRQTSEDLADAFAVAKLIWYEVLLRAGKLTLDQLHPKEIQAFNRTTRAYPVNILGRGWIERSEA